MIMKHLVQSVEEGRSPDGVPFVRVVCQCGTPFRSRLSGEPARRRHSQHAAACRT